jgi:hypothetical protein
MRTAVIRIDVDPEGTLSAADLARGLDVVLAGLAGLGLRLVSKDLAALPARRRELQFLGDGEPQGLRAAAAGLCRRAFGTQVREGTTTFVSRGSDADAEGILAGFGLAGDVSREPGDQGWDIVTVRLAASDLRRVPESRVLTALEASLNCEVRIITTPPEITR